MKIKTLLTTLVIASVLMSCKQLENVGTIKQSILEPTTFSNTQKGIWVLLDGREVSRQSALFKILKDNLKLDVLQNVDGKYYLPNALGTFIRSSNFEGAGLDPDTARLVGTLQQDELKSHTHTYRASDTKKVSGDGSRSEFAWNAASYTTDATGGAETRPKNISMYTYIKIDK